jgi:putative addiction module component (TIGR02574 family)
LVTRATELYDGRMERDVSDVLKDALSLPLEVRGALIDSLIDSLDQGNDAAAEEAWHEEIYRRLHQIDSGAVHLIPWDEGRTRLRSRLKR